ncbi:hypothetical protein ROZALSC1DRAFT_27454 [Rozella allomycis CSF55]|uniref:Uncharacterized protein n=1 Tax=Rozella allomycis (strain CSF55) TaxID=988480 RepID=A0A075ASM5_ROZAC|nr:hypothetical protein O9G_001614 [Rozella allomycis CSF55]RKP21109.1 hypothetical protein ROZALSC1DRAFT_27454 [Rozella allomycis CSF55]|eukprot:EPZ33263.1 hypothetical protein O9G_001614 [Rozella allomycis CSF55]
MPYSRHIPSTREYSNNYINDEHSDNSNENYCESEDELFSRDTWRSIINFFPNVDEEEEGSDEEASSSDESESPLQDIAHLLRVNDRRDYGMLMHKFQELRQSQDSQWFADLISTLEDAMDSIERTEERLDKKVEEIIRKKRELKEQKEIVDGLSREIRDTGYPLFSARPRKKIKREHLDTKLLNR